MTEPHDTAAEGRSALALDRWIPWLAEGGVIEARGASPGPEPPIPRSRLSELAAWLRDQPASIRERERRAAIEVCIWMANADRRLDPEETNVLRTLIDRSGLDDDTQDLLVSEVHDPPSLADLEARLTHPVLRELLLCFAWDLASADGSVARAESAFFEGLAKRLAVPPERVAEIRASRRI